MTVEYRGLESFNDYPGIDRSVNVLFNTERFGIYQIARNPVKLVEHDDEPNLYNFTEDDREYIETYCAIVYYLVFEADKPEHLCRSST